MAKEENGCESLLASLIVDIKSYSGQDHLLPWIRGVKKMKESLPPQILNEKLPRFLQKCAQSFESDKRYKNDSRYIRVWLQLMDFVDDPKALLRAMETKSIGTKRSLFYQAYALYYEKMKRFEEAEKMYRLGVQNLAEPMDELQKSYLQFLSRMERHKKKKTQRQELKSTQRPMSENSIPHKDSETNLNKENLRGGRQYEESKLSIVSHSHEMLHQKVKSQQHEHKSTRNADTTMVKFLDAAIVGKSEVENACHHGLVDPTINMKEAMNAINNMFKEPIETAPVKRKSQRREDKENQSYKNGTTQTTSQPNQDSFEIFVDDENSDETTDENDESGKAFVFLQPQDHSSNNSGETDRHNRPLTRFREDTVVRRFVGSTISDEPMVENVCHHGLVDPTINLKEAMEDINNMFGEPIDFVRPNRSKNRGKAVETKPVPATAFSILEDDTDEEAEQEHKESQPAKSSPNKSDERDLFEPTMCTKVALDEINKLFTMPMDF